MSTERLPAPERSRGSAKTALQLFCALLLMALLVSMVGIEELGAIAANLDPFYLGCLLLLAVVMIWVSCLKWRLFISAGGTEVPMTHLMKLYTMGYFFNTFTPSYIGGDVARSFHLGRYTSNQRDAFISTFLERFTGLLAMAVLGALFVLLGAEATAGLAAAILSVAAGAMVLAAACFSERFAGLMTRAAGAVAGAALPGRIAERAMRLMGRVNEGLKSARNNPPLLFHSLFLSFIFQILTVINTYAAARAVGWNDPPLGGLFIVVPLVLLVSMAPVTPAGIGVQEGAFLFLLRRIGADEAEGLAVGLVLRAKVLLLAAIGGLIWLQVRKQPLPAAPELQQI